jgi:hypothetical protein
MEDTELN